MPEPTMHATPATEAWSPFRRVLAATFLDEAGARAALRAARLPLAPAARVTLLHVLSPWGRHPRARSVREAHGALARLARGTADAARAAGNEDPQLLPLVAQGWPATEILRAAWQEQAELVVMGAPAVRLDRTPRATIARVMRRADLPLLVVRSDPARSYGRILCAVDRSVAAVDTIALAARLAPGGACDVTLFHAYHVPFETRLGSGAAEIEREAVAHLGALAENAAGQLGRVRTVVRRGDPCPEIPRAAMEAQAQVVVVGTHGRSGIARAIFGSAAEWLIAHAPVDVAVARPHRLTLEPRWVVPRKGSRRERRAHG